MRAQNNYYKVKHKMENNQVITWKGYADNYSHAEGLGHQYAVFKTNQQVLHVISMEEIKSPIKNTIQHPTRGRLVCRIFDYGDTVADRYTIAFKGFYISGYGMTYPYLASSEKPFHPQGFGLYCESKQFLTGKHLGKRISFDDCPTEV